MTMTLGRPGTCRAQVCGARFQWAETAKGRAIPVDLEPDPTGNVRLVARNYRPGAPLAEVLTGSELVDARRAGEDLYLAHFATCPGRAHRKGPR